MATMQWDNLLDWLKRRQRWYYGTEYRDLELAEDWLKRPADARYREAVVRLTVPLDGVRNVLIFKPDEIGDAVCALPALAELRRALPDAKLHLICLEEALPIYERSGLVDSIAAVKVRVRWRRFRTLPLREALAQLGAREFDLAIFLKSYPPLFREFLKIPSRLRVHARDPRLVSDTPYQPRISLWGKKRAHQSLQLLEIVSAVTARDYALSDLQYPALKWTDDDRAGLAKVFPNGVAPDKFLVIHPFAKFETRRYPMEYWRELVAELAKDPGLPIVAIGGPADPALEGCDGVIQAQGKLTLGQTGFLLSRAAGFIGNLSGPAHLAGAIGTPTVTLMSGHSAPSEWTPAGTGLVVRADVPCAPCHQWSCPRYDLACLKQLTPARVLADIRAFLKPLVATP